MSIQISCCKDFPKCIIVVLKLQFTSDIQCKIFYRKKWWVTLHPKRGGEMASEKKRLTTLLIYNIWRLKRVFIWQRKIKFENSDALSLLEICTMTLALIELHDSFETSKENSVLVFVTGGNQRDEIRQSLFNMKREYA